MNTFGEFVFWCGGYLLAVVFFFLASITHRRARLAFGILAWLATIGQSGWLYMVIGLTGLTHMQGAQIDAYVAKGRAVYSGIVLALAVAGVWSYFLLRKPKRKPEPIISVPFDP